MENSVSLPPLTSYPAQAVDLAAIEQELSRFGYSPGDPAEASPFTRACMANLVIFCRNASEEQAIAQEIPAIVMQHPSRILLLVVDESKPHPGLEAFVSAHCRLLEEGQSVCSEHITIRTGHAGMQRLPATVRSLLLGDVGTVLWWVPPEAPPLYGPLFYELAELADQVIYDSSAWLDPLRQLILTAQWVKAGRGKIIADLAWRRPKLWRRLIAQSLDPVSAPGALENITAIHIDHGPHALTQAWLLSGWLALRLGWKPRGGRLLPGPEVHWHFTWPHGTPQVRIRRLASGEAEIKTLRVVTHVANHPAIFHFRADSPRQLSVFIEGYGNRTLTLTGPVQSRAEMIARQLPDLTHDLLFEESVALACTMAEAVH